MSGKQTSKYIRLYGATLIQLGERYNVSAYYLYTLHLKGELHQFIEDQEKEKVGIK